MIRAELKAAAKQAIRETKPSPYFIAVIYLVISIVLSTLQSNLSGIKIDMDTYNNVLVPAIMRGDLDYAYSIIQRYTPGGLSRFIGTLVSIMAFMIGLGYTINVLHVFRREPNSAGNLFDGFSMFFKALWLYILIWFFTTLWSLLLVVPGIIAGYRYSQAYYILIDDPSKRAIDCIRESKEMMRGHKMELFVLNLSFLGWYMLGALLIPLIYVLPYTEICYAAYYNYLLDLNRGSGTDGGEYEPRPPEYPNPEEKKDELPPWEYK